MLLMKEPVLGFEEKATQPWLTLTFKLPQVLTQFKTNP